MNNVKRKELRTVTELLNRCSDTISSVLDDEQDCFDNLPESLQESEMGEKIEEAIGYLEETSEYVDNALEAIELASK